MPRKRKVKLLLLLPIQKSCQSWILDEARLKITAQSSIEKNRVIIRNGAEPHRREEGRLDRLNSSVTLQGDAVFSMPPRPPMPLFKKSFSARTTPRTNSSRPNREKSCNRDSGYNVIFAHNERDYVEIERAILRVIIEPLCSNKILNIFFLWKYTRCWKEKESRLFESLKILLQKYCWKRWLNFVFNYLIKLDFAIDFMNIRCRERDFRARFECK